MLGPSKGMRIPLFNHYHLTFLSKLSTSHRPCVLPRRYSLPDGCSPVKSLAPCFTRRHRRCHNTYPTFCLRAPSELGTARLFTRNYFSVFTRLRSDTLLLVLGCVHVAIYGILLSPYVPTFARVSLVVTSIFHMSLSVLSKHPNFVLGCKSQATSFT